MGARVAFLLGAGRSGTTLLYKLLSLHPQVAYLSNYDSRAPGWAPTPLLTRWLAPRMEYKLYAWFSEEGNAYFMGRPWMKRVLPTPVEAEQIYTRCGVPIYPQAGAKLSESSRECLRRSFERLLRLAGGSVLLSKRTANNRRVHLLEQAIPDARYVHLVRDGRDVADSLSRVEWWDDHVLWWDGRTAAQVEATGMPRLRICAKNWATEMMEIQMGLGGVDPARILEVRYERLLDEPQEQLGRILEFMGVPASKEYATAIDRLAIKRQLPSWRKRWTAEQLRDVLAEEAETLIRWGYDPS